ncbi:tRNA (adenosine(37)-N6)-threonylcarbamoyltransferase complex ATPase subunit type 1 TsaE [Cognatishimia maritima]|uniref:tRNA threonylcarbamoyladenosine biosynthesis protein TsaE n=1 Tax=Cognatishimia maritima TaxID=870908 RepID=A0A1M5PGE6_9RHOB|nr:tRNA (adenosine(37)-N6)-threonylcarbamoyltransferase complex ATPase subunit type 1 TsaE [Cognatishimia maritima]SHH00835.1 tRNA threonylcarbamoyladenosine biosynthesis protein TsaE [Cognatishimia maritima]
MARKQLAKTLISPDETADLAAAFASVLKAGDTILLTGDIGAGKTHFSRSLIQHSLGYQEDVPSPTFTLVQTYDAPEHDIWHADLYRLSSPDEVVELGLTEAFETAVCLIEWPDRLEELAPENALSLSLKMTETPGQRQLVISWSAAKWDQKIKDLHLD